MKGATTAVKDIDVLTGAAVAGGSDGSTRSSSEPDDVVAEARRALEVLALGIGTTGPGSGASRADWARLVVACQSVVNTATAVQDVAITRLAAIEEEWLEDGTTGESRRAPGHVALDAPDVVAGALGVSHVHAQRRVALAVRLVADAGTTAGAGEDTAGVGGTGPGAGLSALHAAMVAGELDAYRAGVVAEELAEAPPEVAEAVVGVLVPYLGVETSVQLRRRCRRALARVSPDLLQQRARRAREACGLRRWVEEPGVDRWEGTFPSERAAEGWAAVDALARRYVAEGRCHRVEAARAEALIDLVSEQATIDVHLVVTVPAAVVPEAGASTDDVGADLPQSDTGRRPRLHDGPDAPADRTAEPTPGMVAPRDPDGSSTSVRVPTGPSAASPGRRGTSATHGAASGETRDGDRPTGSPALLGRSRDGGCEGARTVTWPMAVGDEAVVVTSDDDLLEVSGPFPGDPVLVGRAWIRSLLRDPGAAGPRLADTTRRLRRAVRVRQAPCHPVTGALLGSLRAPTVIAEDAGAEGVTGEFLTGGGPTYRPGRRLVALVKARDGRCRFPGCSVAARFCDLDHVRPWPAGPTSAVNLLCLCRRHHRIKQRPGWRVRLLADARAVWTDPTGRVRTTWPRDLLDAVVLREARTSATTVPGAPGSAGAEPLPSGSAWTPRCDAAVESPLEVLLGVLTDPGPGTAPAARASGERGGTVVPWQPRVHVVRPHRRRRVLHEQGGPCHAGRTVAGVRPGAGTGNGRWWGTAGTDPPPF